MGDGREWCIYGTRLRYTAAKDIGGVGNVSSLDFSKFEYRRAVFEARYDRAYPLWDRAGQIWSRISEKWPGIKMNSAEPNNTSFFLNRKYEITVNIDSINIRDHAPKKDVETFYSIVEMLSNTITDSLNVSDFTRLGFRSFYFLKCSSKEDASRKFLDTKKIGLPQGKIFGIQGRALFPEIAFHWVGENLGTILRLKVEERRTEFEPPLEVRELEPVLLDTAGIVLDIDYYTTKNTAIGQFDGRRWLEQAQHIINRDSKTFLGL